MSERPASLDGLLGYVAANLPDEAEATAKARAAIAPLEAKARALRAQLDAKLRADVLREAANRINALPQDWELDPGRGDSADLLRLMADEAQP